MCGIIGCVGRDDLLDVVIGGLSTLEYRGYDSAGVALADDDIDVLKRAGELDALREAILTRQQDDESEPLTGDVGIGHTRWSTHGPPTDANAHPHTDADEQVAVVHNGIIENYQSLRDELEDDGVDFSSDTDTEVIPHLLARKLDEGTDPETAFRETMDRIDGSYAVAAVMADEERVFAARQDSPLVLGIDEDATFLASDVPAFLEYTKDVVYMDDGEIAILEDDEWDVIDASGTVVEKEVKTVEWDADQTGKSGYDHFMLKEINEQPTALRQGLSGRLDELRGQVVTEELDNLETPSEVQFVAAGTSYHAALYGAELFRRAGISASAFISSEYATGPAPIGDDTLVVAVTQSGETADTLSALRTARARGAETLAVTNVVGSTVSRECDHVFYIRSGPEIGVAATKTFSSQLVALNLVVANLAGDGARSLGDTRDLVESLRDLPADLQHVLNESPAQDVVDELTDCDSFFFIGRGLNHPVALEAALKFKEITYEHAEGFPAGELKHGSLALVTENTPVFAIVTGDDERARKTIGNVKEVEARDAPVVAVTDGKSDVERYADYVLPIPESEERVAPLLANVQLQLVAYHMANHLGRSIDKPRNLAKSVTVE